MSIKLSLPSFGPFFQHAGVFLFDASPFLYHLSEIINVSSTIIDTLNHSFIFTNFPKVSDSLRRKGLNRPVAFVNNDTSPECILPLAFATYPTNTKNRVGKPPSTRLVAVIHGT
eukprot:m.427672 g.427672  ORF g.427672 m.427672 type:complete len:114 (-) comp21363_c1_seq17:188-529(-)